MIVVDLHVKIKIAEKNINYGNKFKIRITSKHTGKKIDLNVNFKIIKKTNYN